MRPVISDTNCVIHLEKSDLLEAVLALPYRFVMPEPLFHDEWLGWNRRRMPESVWRSLGLEVCGLSSVQVEQAVRHQNRHLALSHNDCLALVPAESLGDSILMTGDRVLRRIASGRNVEIRGVLWALDEIGKQRIVPLAHLHRALCMWREDPYVFLPDREIKKRIARIEELMS